MMPYDSTAFSCCTVCLLCNDRLSVGIRQCCRSARTARLNEQIIRAVQLIRAGEAG